MLHARELFLAIKRVRLLFKQVPSPLKCCANNVPNGVGFWRLGLALSEKQIPQVVVNVANSKHGMERMESLSVLAKQVLSQLSYTPTVN
jgi:hypothetical protein